MENVLVFFAAVITERRVLLVSNQVGPRLQTMSLLMVVVKLEPLAVI